MLHSRSETLADIFNTNSQVGAPVRADLFSASYTKDEKLVKTYRVEQSDSISLPNVIVPQSDTLEDLFATVATYYPDQSPITALIHVLDGEMERSLDHSATPEPRSCDGLDSRYRKASLGAALGEAVLAGLSVSESVSSTPSYSAVRRTLAFTLGRCQHLYKDLVPFEHLSKRWMQLRDMTRLGYTQPVVSAVLRVHELVRPSSAKLSDFADIELIQGVQAFVRGDDLDGKHIEAVIRKCYPGTAAHLRELTGVFDDRMKAFIRLVEIIQSKSLGTEIDEVAVAFVCNRILPSSFSHVGVLLPLIEFFPAALVWYGFFSTLSKPSKSTSVNFGLLLKLERDLFEPFSYKQRPRCDISLDELEVLSRVGLRSEIIKPTQQRVLLVSLLPGIDIYTRFGGESETSSDLLARRNALTTATHDRVAALLQEALETLRSGPARQSKEFSVSAAGKKERKRSR
jgi:hypothetical protein